MYIHINGGFSSRGMFDWLRLLTVIPSENYQQKGGTSRSMATSGTDLLEVPTIYKAYFLGLCKGIYTPNMALYGTVPPF